MNVQNITTTAAAATPAIITDELQDFDFGAEAAPAKTSPEPKSATVADSKPIDGEVIKPSGEVVAASGEVSKPLTEGKIARIADRIRARNRKAIEGIVENGRDLIEVKKSLPHGNFLPWLTKEFGWSERTANNYMNATREFDGLVSQGCKPDTIMLVAPTTLYNLNKLPEKDKSAFVKEIKSGSINKLRIAKAKPATIMSAKKTSASTASTGKGQDKAEELAKLIVEALPHAVRERISGHPGFASPAFGELLGKELAASFGAASSGGAE